MIETVDTVWVVVREDQCPPDERGFTTTFAKSACKPVWESAMDYFRLACDGRGVVSCSLWLCCRACGRVWPVLAGGLTQYSLDSIRRGFGPFGPAVEAVARKLSACGEDKGTYRDCQCSRIGVRVD